MVFAVAIFEATRLHFDFTESGREKAGRAQLVRGVVGQIQRDLRSVFSGWQAVSKDASSEQADSNEEASDEETAATAEAASSQAISEFEVPAGGILGFADAITMIVARSTAGLPFAPEYVPAPDAHPMSDLKLVRYWYGSPGVDTNDARVGLVRQEIDYVPDVTAGDDPASGARTEILAEEVRGLAIRYFDGSTWYTEWDQTRESAPLAVEVVLAMARTSPALRANDREEEIEYFRVVVAAADAEPPADADADSGTTSGASSSESESEEESEPSTSEESDGAMDNENVPSLDDLPADLPSPPQGGPRQ